MIQDGNIISCLLFLQRINNNWMAFAIGFLAWYALKLISVICYLNIFIFLLTVNSTAHNADSYHNMRVECKAYCECCASKKGSLDFLMPKTWEFLIISIILTMHRLITREIFYVSKICCVDGNINPSVQQNRLLGGQLTYWPLGYIGVFQNYNS